VTGSTENSQIQSAWRLADANPVRTCIQIALLVALLATGCFVADELDSGSEQLEKHSPSSSSPSKDAKSAGPNPKEAGAEPRTADWWQKARTLEPRSEDSDLVRCRLAGTTQFMRTADCLSRGGKPSR
jgi:hypothetical protein